MRQVVIYPDEPYGYYVEVPSLPGCVSQGETIEEAIENIKDAINLWIEDMIADGEEVPEDLPEPVQIVSV
jgi:predicted RNase H-like HicB family nuclease